MNVRRTLDSVWPGLFAMNHELGDGHGIFDEETFQKTIASERRRTERSHKPLLLMLLDVGAEMSADTDVLGKILGVLSRSTRETDVVGWYKHGVVVGAMFTEMDPEGKKYILSTMLTRITAALQGGLSFEQFNQLNVSFHWFPEEWGNGVPKRPSKIFYRDLAETGNRKTVSGHIKRLMDIVGSLIALTIFSPLFLIVGAAIKLTSRGPVIFRQERLGQFGSTFTCLKFRSMCVNNDVTIHKEFIKQIINGEYEAKDAGNGQHVYKMTNDPRTTRLGRFLRRTSLDELPQFINVLKGEMSLVGPRPPLAYEFQQYDIWHRRRVLGVKPGITGLWQVNGRSRVRFDDMVRLDLRYVRSRSLWLDIQILLRTPRAVLLGNDGF